MLVDGREITPETIGLNLFNRFNREVEDFLAAAGAKCRWMKPGYQSRKAPIGWL
jgi:hypothetical protein